MQKIFDLVPRWVYPGWWTYVFKDNEGVRNIICRMRGHAGVVWYNCGGLEPDMSCSRCGEDLG